MPPLAVNVAGLPTQTAVELGTMLIVGMGLAITDTVVLPEQVPSVAVTV